MKDWNERLQVINNIKDCTEREDFNAKVELHDPVLTPADCRKITDHYLQKRKTAGYRVKTAIAVQIAKILTKKINRDTRIEGLESIRGLDGGFLLTSNHFSPTENTVVRFLTDQMGKKLSIISQTSNFAMKGKFGFFMKYAETIPISADAHYISHGLMDVLREKMVEEHRVVLLYPEQEMWYHYRLPRPPKKGAYYFAAKLQVPILSCFVEIKEGANPEPDLNDISHVMHVLGVLTPDASKGFKECYADLAKRDYELKKACYESCYGKPLDYTFCAENIAGLKGNEKILISD